MSALTISRAISRAQRQLAQAIGVDEQRRSDTVMSMHANNARRAPGYWIQLFLSMGIATLGLVLDSTAVVIGAMLVSPLMGPIIELGMGFAVGSSLLVIRAFFRTTISVLVVVAGAAALTMVLPFQEVTREISTRTAPTALDLLVAVFCALAAAYTTVRNSADSAAAAAGTAIGIALMPPLCTIGFGIGTGSASIANGAGLLFTANLSAIVVVAVLTFLALGFNQVDAESIERQYQAYGRSDHAASAAHRLLGRVFGSRFGLAMRVAIPVAFLAMVAVPLGRALNDVAWEVRTRGAIRRILERETPGAVQTSVSVDRQAIVLRLLLIGSNDDAMAAERRVGQMIGEIGGVVPRISVIPVADGRMLAAATKAEASEPSTATPGAALTEAKTNIARALSTLWPASAGRIVGWQLSLAEKGPGTLVVRHVGPPLGDMGVALLSLAASAHVGQPIQVRDAPIRPSALVRRGNDLAWADSAESLLMQIAATDSVVACLHTPVASARGTARDRATIARLQRVISANPSRLVIAGSGAWSLRAAIATCGDSVR